MFGNAIIGFAGQFWVYFPLCLLVLCGGGRLYLDFMEHRLCAFPRKFVPFLCGDGLGHGKFSSGSTQINKCPGPPCLGLETGCRRFHLHIISLHPKQLRQDQRLVQTEGLRCFGALSPLTKPPAA